MRRRGSSTRSGRAGGRTAMSARRWRGREACGGTVYDRLGPHLKRRQVAGLRPRRPHRGAVDEARRSRPWPALSSPEPPHSPHLPDELGRDRAGELFGATAARGTRPPLAVLEARAPGVRPRAGAARSGTRLRRGSPGTTLRPRRRAARRGRRRRRTPPIRVSRRSRWPVPSKPVIGCPGPGIVSSIPRCTSSRSPRSGRPAAPATSTTGPRSPRGRPRGRPGGA